MDWATTRRGKDTWRRRHGPHFTVVIVGEVFTANAAHPLSPVVPSERIPFALLPICNTPIIDYILENLAENGVDEVCILLNSASVESVRRHLQENRTARGKPWLESKDMKVQIVGSVREMVRLYDAATEIVDHNLVGQSSSFLFVPIDAIAIFTNLRHLFHVHLQRTKNIKSYTATLLCTSVKSALKDTLHDVLVSGLAEQVRRNGSGSDSVGLEQEESTFAGTGIRVAERRPFAPPEFPPNHLTMLTLQKSTGVVRSMTRLEPRDEMAEPTMIEFSKHDQISVRTDLVPTSFFFCSGGALSLFTFHMTDPHSFFVDLLVKQELQGNVFGIQVVEPPMGIVQPINSLRTYIETNVEVCSRRFFPLIREYSFAEDRALYAVSPHCPSVYLHRVGAKVLSNTCEPCVVVGEHVVVPLNTVVRGTILGNGVQIGDGTVIVGCVILDGARIGCGCVLHYSLIGSGVVIGDRTEMSNTIIGDGCVIGVGETNEKSSGTGAKSIVLQGEAIVACDEAQTEKRVAGNGGCGKALPKQITCSILSTRTIFVRDPVPRSGDGATDDDDDDDDDGDDNANKFGETVATLVDQAMEKPSCIEHCVFQMKSSRLTFGRKNRDLCYVVTERLLVHVLENYGNKEDSHLALRAAVDLFVLWCHPFFSEMVTGDDEMQAVLEATCSAVGKVGCALHLCGPVLLECLYNGCDDELYDERGYCIVSGESLVKFGERMRKLERQRALNTDDTSSDGNADMDAREEGMLRVALSCHPFIAGVRAFLEEEEEEEEYN